MKITNALNVERLRNFQGFEEVSQNEGEHILQTLKDYSIILYSVYKTIKQKQQKISYN
jgi:hypothetical protein